MAESVAPQLAQNTSTPAQNKPASVASLRNNDRISTRPQQHAVTIAVLFGVTVWILVSLFGGFLLMAHYRQTTYAADERIKQITEQVVRTSTKINAAQAEGMSASTSEKLFLVTVMLANSKSDMRPQGVRPDVWQRWLALAKNQDVTHRKDNYLIRWAEVKANDGTPLWVNVAQSEVRALESYFPVRNYTIGVWLTFSLGIMFATAILARTLSRRSAAEVALKQSEAALRAREADLVSAQSIAKFGSWRIDLHSGNIEPSEEYLALFEITAKTCPRNIDEWITRFLPEQTDAQDARHRFQQAHIAGFPYEGTRRVVLDSGKIKWIQFYARPVFDSSGAHIAFLGVTRDVTEERMAAEHLAASEERYRVISENMQDIVSLHTRDGAVLYASPSLHRLLGHRLERAIGNSPIPYIHPSEQQLVLNACQVLINNPTQSVKVEYRIRAAGGHYVWFETLFDAVFHPSGRLRHFQATSRDISARKTAESSLAKRTSQLSAANRLLTREVDRRQALERRVLLDIEMELAQVGLELHDDLGQDLTGIALLTKTLERKLSDAGQKTAEDAARISDLVNRAIRHTRMIAHGLSPYVWGESGLVSALTQLASDIDSLGIVSCIARLDERTMIEDEIVIRSLYRIAQEATNNALKHSQASHIRIGLKRLPHAIQLVIADDGGTQHNQILGSALPLSGIADTKFKGTGLHSIRHRAQTIDARVNVRVSPGRGTVIRVLLDHDKTGLARTTRLLEDTQSMRTQPSGLTVM